MKGEHGRDKCAWPNAPGRSPQEQQQQQCVGDVNRDTGQVMAAGPISVKLIVELMREPGERMRIASVPGC